MQIHSSSSLLPQNTSSTNQQTCLASVQVSLRSRTLQQHDAYFHALRPTPCSFLPFEQLLARNQLRQLGLLLHASLRPRLLAASSTVHLLPQHPCLQVRQAHAGLHVSVLLLQILLLQQKMR